MVAQQCKCTECLQAAHLKNELHGKFVLYIYFLCHSFKIVAMSLAKIRDSVAVLTFAD